MAWTEQITCDGCGKKKGDVNHWWLMEKTANEFRIYRWNEQTTKGLIRRAKHLCGQECVIKAVNEYLSGGK
jgi:adenine-specific DNA methylase